MRGLSLFLVLVGAAALVSAQTVPAPTATSGPVVGVLLSNVRTSTSCGATTTCINCCSSPNYVATGGFNNPTYPFSWQYANYNGGALWLPSTANQCNAILSFPWQSGTLAVAYLFATNGDLSFYAVPSAQVQPGLLASNSSQIVPLPGACTGTPVAQFPNAVAQWNLASSCSVNSIANQTLVNITSGATSANVVNSWYYGLTSGRPAAAASCTTTTSLSCPNINPNAQCSTSSAPTCTTGTPTNQLLFSLQLFNPCPSQCDGDTVRQCYNLMNSCNVTQPQNLTGQCTCLGQGLPLCQQLSTGCLPSDKWPAAQLSAFSNANTSVCAAAAAAAAAALAAASTSSGSGAGAGTAIGIIIGVIGGVILLLFLYRRYQRQEQLKNAPQGANITGA